MDEVAYMWSRDIKNQGLWVLRKENKKNSHSSITWFRLTICANAHSFIPLQRIIAVLLLHTHSKAVSSVWLSHSFNSTRQKVKSNPEALNQNRQWNPNSNTLSYQTSVLCSRAFNKFIQPFGEIPVEWPEVLPAFPAASLSNAFSINLYKTWICFLQAFIAI